jgi:hypothetical protein
MMQCRNNARCSRLLDVIERNWILRPKPPPGFFHAAILNLIPNVVKNSAAGFASIHQTERQ